MKVFFSWSGERSRAVAEALAPWLGRIIQALEPWSSTNIPKGSRWGPEVSVQLERTKIGIICLTRDNLHAPWILFEAGALSKTTDGVVATFLLDIVGTDVEQPLAQFQHTTADEGDVRKLAHTLNNFVRAAGDRAIPDADLDELFDETWPNLKARLDKIQDLPAPNTSAPVRADGDILREILDAVRTQQAVGAPRFLEASDAVVDDGVEYTYRLKFQKGVDEKRVTSLIFWLSSRLLNCRISTPEPDAAGGTTLKVTTGRPSMRPIQALLEKTGLTDASIEPVMAREA